MAEPRGCTETREVIPELATGVASGEVRARAMTHLARCARCRRELEDASSTVDELMLLAPELDPPTGFENRVLVALPHRARWRTRVGVALLSAAALAVVAAVAAGIVWSRTADDRELATQYRQTLAAADGRYLRAADLTVGGAETGHVFGYEGSPSWIFVTVDDAPVSGSYEVRLVTTDGAVTEIGTCRVAAGHGAWGTAIDRPIHEIQQVRLVRDDAAPLTAEFRPG